MHDEQPILPKLKAPVVNDITPFAATNFHNAKRIFGIKKDDRRRHMYVIGKTGMGKSTLLENLVFADIHSGNGTCYVDPHGDTAEKILQWIPKNRIADTIYFNPADRMHPIAFNVLERVEPIFRNNIASGLVSVYKKLWADSWGPRLEYILRYTLLALLDAPDSTLLGVNRILVDKPYLQHVLRYVEDPVVRSFWNDEFSKWNERNLAEVISPIQNKVGQFVSNSMIRNIIGQQDSTISMRKIMDEKKILILNLSKGHMGEDASALLGAMLITKIQLAAMSRVEIKNEEDREDFYLYVDEFQNFVTESFANILSEARKYRLCLTVAHQYIAQLTIGSSTTVRDAVFGNVGTVIAFRVGATDAEFLEKEFTPQFLIEDLINLPQYKIYLRLMVNGVSSDPFSADTLPPLGKQDLGNGQEVIDYTRAHYTRTREEVMNTINTWATKDYASEKSAPGAPNTDAGGFHTGTTPAQAYAAAQKQDEVREVKPIVWHGECDACGKKLDLTFTPDESRPILCQDDLKLFRKGGLPGPTVEKMMMKVMERKAALSKPKAVISTPAVVSPVAQTPRHGSEHETKNVASTKSITQTSVKGSFAPKPLNAKTHDSRPPRKDFSKSNTPNKPPYSSKPSAEPVKGTIRMVDKFTDEKKSAPSTPESSTKGKITIDPGILAALKAKEDSRPSTTSDSLRLHSGQAAQGRESKEETQTQETQKVDPVKAVEEPKPVQPVENVKTPEAAKPTQPSKLTPGQKIEF